MYIQGDARGIAGKTHAVCFGITGLHAGSFTFSLAACTALTYVRGPLRGAEKLSPEFSEPVYGQIISVAGLSAAAAEILG
jgi:hypothetical protein